MIFVAFLLRGYGCLKGHKSVPFTTSYIQRPVLGHR